MDVVIQRLFESFRQLLATQDLAAEGYAGNPEDEILDVSELAETFESVHGLPCPPSMQSALILPDVVSVKWSFNDEVSGEIQISNPFVSIKRTLDVSLMDWTLDGHKLADMRVADAVTDMAGPLYILFEVNSSKISEQLFLFDSRELRRIELSYPAYLEMAAVTRGIIYWQYLFCDQWLILTMADVLSAELDFLESRFPAPELGMLRERLRERTRSS